MKLINCVGTLIDLSIPKIMGVINITPDSFYDGGKFIEDSSIIKNVRQMINEGADFIEVGAVSTRPGANPVNEAEEMKRLLPAIELIRNEFPSVIISVDTYRALVAEKAVEKGAQMINDISAGEFDDKMFEMIARLRVPYIIMHMQGTPQTMQDNPVYKDVTYDIMNFFVRRLEKLRALYIHDVIIDSGFGFGKTVEHNYELLRNLSLFKSFDCPIMVGVSRKSMICKVLNINPDKALNGTTVVNTLALLSGANILRVHDVREAVECVKIVTKFKAGSLKVV